MYAKAMVLGVLATLGSAHIKLKNPVPYGVKSLDNGPLRPDGSDFPCKLPNLPWVVDGAPNVYPQGSTQKLVFVGVAVHGGGSCQVCLTKDKMPNKESTWRCIKSYMGGCPAKDTAGNLARGGADTVVPYTYDYTIPNQLPAYEYTMAWTWFNKVGAREMYMNCAPFKVTGTEGSWEFFDSLPEMFVANVGPTLDGSYCGTTEMKDLVFPDPGDDVDYFNGKTTVWAGPTGGNWGMGRCKPKVRSSRQVVGDRGKTSTAARPTTSGKGGIFKTVAPATLETANTLPVAVSSSTTAMVSTSAPSAAPMPSSTSSEAPEPSGVRVGQLFEAGSKCKTHGIWNCVEGKRWQRCVWYTWTADMPLAPGTGCVPGVDDDLRIHHV